MRRWCKQKESVKENRKATNRERSITELWCVDANPTGGDDLRALLHNRNASALGDAHLLIRTLIGGRYDVSYWRLADMTERLPHVRFRVMQTSPDDPKCPLLNHFDVRSV
jgi:hypothetical protein